MLCRHSIAFPTFDRAAKLYSGQLPAWREYPDHPAFPIPAAAAISTACCNTQRLPSYSLWPATVDKMVKLVYYVCMTLKQDTRIQMYERLRRIVEKHAVAEERPFRLSDTVALSPREVRTIEFLKQIGPFNVTNVADHFQFTKSAASQLVNRLVKRGLVCKEMSPHSDKEYHLSLTEEGLEAYRLVQTMDRQRLETFLGKIDGFTRQEVETAGTVLEAVERMMDERIERFS
eukprot:TRINITY_DN15739_c0_g2_i1.p1 TRINITY_DN15739_c0_g2~~TRINITY_DN15739_c0_g2_i1.p1  ORF type:complete len:231 (-),score=29.67 TRINITY_DN15739_c0_g2_i1:366-1058(-)